MENFELPHDILLLILVRLPVISLLRFRCVSKSWKLLISTQDFANMHYNQSRIYPKPLRLIWKKELNCKTHIFAVDFSKLDNSSAETIHLLHPFEVPETIESTLIGSCNGLLCLTSPCPKGYRYEEFFLVFNPLIRKGSTFYGESGWCRFGRSFYYGFGYDDVHDDYKVVTMGVRPDEFWPDPDFSKFNVYSVRDGSWSTINSGLTCSYTYGISCGVLVNCVLHWIWKNDDNRYNIVAFDLRTEEHWIMEAPENGLALPRIGVENQDRMDLGILNGFLCGIRLYSDVPDKGSNKLDLWIMKEYGAKDSWTKTTIDLSREHTFECSLLNKRSRVTSIVPIVNIESKKQMILYSFLEGFLQCDMVNNQLTKVIKIPKFDPRMHHRMTGNFWFVPKEFLFEGSLVRLPGFDDSFDSLWNEEVEVDQGKTRTEDESKM